MRMVFEKPIAQYLWVKPHKRHKSCTEKSTTNEKSISYKFFKLPKSETVLALVLGAKNFAKKASCKCSSV